MIRARISKLFGSGTRPWRERVTLSQLLTWTVAIAIIGAILTNGYYALNVLYQNKLVDTWAIMFLELEHEGSILSQRLRDFGKGLDQAAKSDDIVLKVGNDGGLEALQGNVLGVKNLSDFKIANAVDFSTVGQIKVLSDSGQNYLALFNQERKQLILRKTASRHFALHPGRPADQGSLYLITLEGRLLHSNSQEINEINLTDRDLVQRFIKAPIRQGQLEFTDKDGVNLYGFFSEVPDTNLILFSEVTRAAAMAPVRQIVIQFLWVLVGIVVVVILMLQLPLSRIMDPIKELAGIAKLVGNGEFNVKPKLQAFGELSLLSNAFGSMAKGLGERDRRVALLMREQGEKMRLAGEMAIARRIQENLLPSGGLPADSGLALAAVYISASECAGDWYQYAFNPVSRETVFVIADVSGHGAGSSVFTAIIAGLFDQARHRGESRFPLEEFVHHTNATIFRLGKQQWHATMFIARYVAGSGEIDYINAGHPAPFIKRNDAVESLKIRSESVLGLNADASFPSHQVKFEHLDTLLMYTDGLIEAARPDGRMFGRKRVRDMLKHSANNPASALTGAMDIWRSYLAGTSPPDDVCVLLVRAA